MKRLKLPAGLLIAVSFGCFAAIVPPALGQGATARWSRGVGGTADDCGFAVCADANGNIYVSGYFNEIAGFGRTNLVSAGGQDIFVAKYDSAGNVRWATRAGGQGQDQARGVALDRNGNVYVTGQVSGPSSFGTNVIDGFRDDIFVAKLDAEGNWVWATVAGGAGVDEGRGIGVDSEGNCYIAAVFSATAAFGATNLTSAGQMDAVLARCDSAGQWLWIKAMGGPGLEEARGVAVDASGDSYVAGLFHGAAVFAGTNMTSRGASDTFLAAFDAEGELRWVRQAGGAEIDAGNGVAVDRSGEPHLTGGFAGTARFGSNQVLSATTGFAGTMDIFVAKYTRQGELQWVQRAGGNNQDAGLTIALDGEGNSYASGLFLGTASFGSTVLSTGSGQADLFIAKFNPRGNLLWAFHSAGNAYMSGNGIAVDSEGASYVTGFFRANTTFAGMVMTNNSAGRDGYVARVDGPPRLRISRSAGSVQLQWPAWASGFQLQSATGFASGTVWSAVTNVPQAGGEQQTVGQNAGDGRRVFRLRKP